MGTILGGGTQANGLTWWNVNYDLYYDGWSSQNFLELVPTSTPPPVVSPVPTTPPPVVSPVPPTTPLTDQERLNLIQALQAQLITLIQQLITLLTQQLQSVGAMILGAFNKIF